MISLRKHSRPKMLVEQQLAVMHLAVVDVEVQAAAGGEQAVGLGQARLEEGQVIVEQVGVAARAELDRPVAAPGEAGPVPGAVLGPYSLDLGARLAPARVEGRVDVDEVDGMGRKRLENRKVIAKEYGVGGHGDILLGVGRKGVRNS